jgi:hypothetical protein
LGAFVSVVEFLQAVFVENMLAIECQLEAFQRNTPSKGDSS